MFRRDLEEFWSSALLFKKGPFPLGVLRFRVLGWGLGLRA